MFGGIVDNNQIELEVKVRDLEARLNSVTEDYNYYRAATTEFWKSFKMLPDFLNSLKMSSRSDRELQDKKNFLRFFFLVSKTIIAVEGMEREQIDSFAKSVYNQIMSSQD